MSKQIKIAHTKHNVHELIRERWSARAFSSKAISQDDLNALVEAASWAPSSMNEQPWRYVYAHKGEANFDKMVECLVPGNQSWAKNAAVLILNLVKTNHAANDTPNFYAFYDAGAANVNLLTQAIAYGIHGHIMGGFDREKLKATFHIPEGFQPVVFIALGYLDSPESLEEPFKARELTARSRKELSEILFHNEFPKK